MDLPRLNNTIQGLGFAIGQQRPFLGFLVKNWPLTLIAGLALFSKLRERHKKGDLSTYNALADAGLVLSPLVGLALLNQLAKQEQQMNAAGAQAIAQTAPPMPALPGA
jgi:hypothetical protein